MSESGNYTPVYDDEQWFGDYGAGADGSIGQVRVATYARDECSGVRDHAPVRLYVEEGGQEVGGGAEAYLTVEDAEQVVAALQAAIEKTKAAATEDGS
jgi:hypothetical protein